MHGIFCEECNLFVRGSAKDFKEHKKTQKHKKNHERFILNKHLEAKSNKKLNIEEFLLKKEKKEEKEKTTQKEQIMTKLDLKQELDKVRHLNNEKVIWRKVVDIGKNKILYENLITGKLQEETPFGLDADNIPIIGIDHVIPHVSENWQEIDNNVNFIEQNKEFKYQHEKDKERNLMKKNEKIDDLWEKGKNNIKHAVSIFLNNKDDFDDKFEKLEFLAKKNVELEIKKEKEELASGNDNINHNLFRKRKIRKE
jgi:hypothetical protein